MRVRRLKRFRRAAVIVLLALAAPGCGANQPTPAAPSDPAPAALGLGSAERINAWRHQHYEAFKTLGTASGRLVTAINRADFDGIHTVCRDLTSANQQIRTSLPTPDQALTTALRELTGQLNELTRRCPTLSFRSNTGDFIQFGAEVKGAARSFETARAILSTAESR
jgi:hypothetical protein